YLPTAGCSAPDLRKFRAGGVIVTSLLSPSLASCGRRRGRKGNQSAGLGNLEQALRIIRPLNQCAIKAVGALSGCGIDKSCDPCWSWIGEHARPGFCVRGCLDQISEADGARDGDL